MFICLCNKKIKNTNLHIEAGNRCYDQRVPEEINRKIIDHISDINVTYSEIAKENLLRENLPLIELLKIGTFIRYIKLIEKIENSKILQKLSLKKNNFFGKCS